MFPINGFIFPCKKYICLRIFENCLFEQSCATHKQFLWRLSLRLNINTDGRLHKDQPRPPGGRASLPAAALRLSLDLDLDMVLRSCPVTARLRRKFPRRLSGQLGWACSGPQHHHHYFHHFRRHSPCFLGHPTEYPRPVQADS